MALTKESFSDGGCPPPFSTTPPNHWNDNVGVSIANFDFPRVPEPASLLLLAFGLLALARLKIEKAVENLF